MKVMHRNGSRLAKQAAALSRHHVIEANQIPAGRAETVERSTGRSTPAVAPAPHREPTTLEALEREHILRVLNQSEGNRERAAAILGISSRTLYRKLREYETQARSAGLATEG